MKPERVAREYPQAIRALEQWRPPRPPGSKVRDRNAGSWREGVDRALSGDDDDAGDW